MLCNWLPPAVQVVSAALYSLEVEGVCTVRYLWHSVPILLLVADLDHSCRLDGGYGGDRAPPPLSTVARLCEA